MSVNSDLLLDPVSHDLVIEGYDFQISDGLTATAQRLKVRLKLFLGEWFLAINEGVPYYEDILVKNPDLTLIEADLKAQILTVPLVAELLSFSMELDNATRTLHVEFSVRTTDDETIDLDITLP